jgi:hypothetical protein
MATVIAPLVEQHIPSKRAVWRRFVINCHSFILHTHIIHVLVKGAEGAYYLSEALKVNATLQNCYVSGNNIGDEGAWYIAEALQVSRERREGGGVVVSR